jgi:uncharacterized protein YjbI with pentapeptide repeats
MTRRALAHLLSALTVAAGAGCEQTADTHDTPDEPVAAALQGENLAGSNLAATNLAGSNLAGSNLAGFNMGGTNLAGSNLAGSNLAGSNMGGNNLAGSNLAGSNLAGSNLAGSNLAGSNLAGNSIAGTRLGASNLSSSATGSNIHDLGGSAAGMLYSREDEWMPKTGQCIVMGIGSTAFAKLLGQQSPNARISLALGKLPWGFAATSGGPMALAAWEAVVWGDRTYCTFVLAAPPGASWPGVAGFIKAIFRWNAPPSQSMDLSGIEASAPLDPTLSTAVTTYAGMMNAAAQFRAGKIPAFNMLAGELAFITATTNNQAVLVDFASWVRDSANGSLVLGNVQPTNPPTHAETVYVAVDNGDGTVGISLADSAAVGTVPPSITDAFLDLRMAYNAYRNGDVPKPIARRCGGALSLQWGFGEPVPVGKCDAGLSWIATNYVVQGNAPWSTVAGTTAPMNGYMQLSQPGGAYRRGPVGAVKPVLSETYVHMWERNYDFGPPASLTGRGTVTASKSGTSPEDMTRAFDQSTATKWFVSGSATPWIAFRSPFPRALTSYRIGSGNDVPARDPRSWVLEGSNDGITWTAIDTRSDQVFASRQQLVTYTVAGSAPYTRYRLRVTANNGAKDFQLSELQLFGN